MESSITGSNGSRVTGGEEYTMKQSEIINKQLEAVEAEYDAAYQRMVTDNPEWTPENLDALWKRFWTSTGKELVARKEDLEAQYIRELNREIQVGDGVTMYLYSDAQAFTVIARTAKTMKIQRDKATLSPDFKPEWVPGGFSAICVNSEDQKWSYERDPKGAVRTCRWSEKNGRWQTGSDGSIHIGRGRHEHYDYNF